ncbi:MAG: hypothetical protein HRU19_10705 [Pseudobacteriovorax sp.]|nr:hypothetical protein [Pseudobacteriovorax sp.]
MFRLTLKFLIMIFLLQPKLMAKLEDPKEYNSIFQNESASLRDVSVAQLRAMLGAPTTSEEQRYLIERTIWLKERSNREFCTNSVKFKDYEARFRCYDSILQEKPEVLIQLHKLYEVSIRDKKYVAAAKSAEAILKKSALHGDYYNFERMYKKVIRDIPKDATVSHLRITAAVGTSYALSNSPDVLDRGMDLLHRVEKSYAKYPKQFERDLLFVRYNMGIFYLFKYNDPIRAENYFEKTFNFEQLYADTVVFHSLARLMNGKTDNIIENLRTIDYDGYNKKVRIGFLQCYKNYILFKLGEPYDLSYCYELGVDEQFDVILHITGLFASDEAISEELRSLVFRQFWNYYDANISNLTSNTIKTAIDSVELTRARSEAQRKELELTRSQLIAKEQEQTKQKVIMFSSVLIIIGLLAWWNHKKNLELTILQEQKEKQEISGEFQKVETILDTLHQGIISIWDQNGVVDITTVSKSKNLLKIIETYDLENERNVFDFFFAKTSLDDSDIQVIKTVFAAVMHDDLINFELNQSLLPIECRLGKKWINIDYCPVYDLDHKVIQLIISIKDVTEPRLMQFESEQNKINITIISEIVEFGVDRSTELLTDFEKRFESVKKTVFETYSSYSDILIFLHNSKGNFHTANFKLLVSLIHDLETAYETKIQQQLKNIIIEIDGYINLYLRIIHEKLSHSYSVNNNDSFTKVLDQIIKLDIDAEKKIEKVMFHRNLIGSVSFRDLFSVLEKQLNKSIYPKNQNGSFIIRYKSDEVQELRITAKFHTEIKNIFNHLCLNSISHGFKKDRKSYICVSMKLSNSLIVRYSDSGVGLNLKKLEEKYGEKGSDQRLASTIFEQGVSTDDSTSIISGRGVGMFAVKNAIETIGGSIEVEFTDEKVKDGYKGFEFVIVFPRKVLVELGVGKIYQLDGVV